MQALALPHCSNKDARLCSLFCWVTLYWDGLLINYLDFAALKIFAIWLRQPVPWSLILLYSARVSSYSHQQIKFVMLFSVHTSSLYCLEMQSKKLGRVGLFSLPQPPLSSGWVCPLKHFNGLEVRLIDCFIEWLSYWWSDRVIEGFIEWLMGWSGDWMIEPDMSLCCYHERDKGRVGLLLIWYANELSVHIVRIQTFPAPLLIGQSSN